MAKARPSGVDSLDGSSTDAQSFVGSSEIPPATAAKNRLDFALARTARF